MNKNLFIDTLSTLALGANAQGKYTIKSNLQNAEGQKYICILATWGTWILTAPSSLMANLP